MNGVLDVKAFPATHLARGGLDGCGPERGRPGRVAQVYVTQPAGVGEPPKSLRGFQRVTLNPGQTQHVTISLDARSFQYWNGAWTNASGVHTVSVGASSMDLRLTGQVSIAGGVVTPPPGTNLAQGKPVTATGSVGGYPPGNAVDGNTGSVTIPSTTQRYFRLTFTGNTGWPAAQLSELRLYGS